MQTATDSRRIHELFGPLERFDLECCWQDLPKNGIYVFYEKGEVYQYGSSNEERIVRIGTHRVDGRLRQRLRYHYRGNTRGSVFRRHLGAALIEANLVDATVIAEQRALGIKHPPELEEAISERLKNEFKFSVVEIDGAERRLRIEAGLIGSLANSPVASPSANWLGRYLPVREIRTSGLWNRNHVTGPDISDSDFDHLVGVIGS